MCGKSCQNRYWQRPMRNFFQLGNPCGEDGIRQAVAEYLYRSRGVKCKREQIIIGAGNDYLLMLLGTILGDGQTVAMEVATYISAYL